MLFDSRPLRRVGVCASVRARMASAVLALVGSAILFSPGARAQAFGEILDSEIPLSTKTGRNLGVQDRSFEALTPQGIPAGGFRVFPAVELATGYTSNVLGAEQSREGDIYAQLGLDVIARSDWSRHALTGTFSYDGRRYADTSAKNENRYVAQLSGKFDIVGESKIEANVARRRSYEDQFVGSFPATGGGAIAIDQTTAMLRGTYLLNRLRMTGSADYNRLTFSDTVTTTGTVLPQAFRDRKILRGSARLEYLLTRDNAVFAQFSYRDTRYDIKSGIDNRSSKEWRASVGAIADLTSLIRVAFGVGYNRRTYSNPLYTSIGGLSADARADYFITSLSTISLVASRKIEEATLLNSPGFVATRLGARVDHELLRNLRLYLNVQSQHDAFKNINRRDKLFMIGGGATYSISRNFLVQPRAEYIDRKSTGDLRGPNIKDFRAVLSFTARL